MSLNNLEGIIYTYETFFLQELNEAIEEYCDAYWEGEEDSVMKMHLPKEDVDFLMKNDRWRRFVESCLDTKIK